MSAATRRSMHVGLLDRLFQREPAYRQSTAERRKERLAQLHHEQRLVAQYASRLSCVYDPRTASFAAAGAQPIQQITQRAFGSGTGHETQLLVFHLMRQYVPTLDAAIRNRRTLEGDVIITSKDQGLAGSLTEWAQGVAVGYMGGVATLRGLDTYANMMADNADEYGLSAGEIVAEERGREIERLVVPNARTLSLRKPTKGSVRELWQSAEGVGPRRIDDNPLVQVLAFSAGAESAWPYPLAWSLIKSTEALLRMYEAVINGWWRFGDPSLLLGFEYDAKALEASGGLDLDEETVDGEVLEVPRDLLLFKDTVEAVMAARRRGEVGDAYVYGHGAKVVNQVLGQVDQTLMRYFREHASMFDGHIVGASDTPVWMYPHLEAKGDGLGSARSNNQALIAAVGAEKRNVLKGRLLRGAIDTHLVVSGDARYVGKYDLAFETANILDDKVEAEARKVAAEAEAAEIENAVQLFDEEGNRRFSGEAEKYLKERGILQ